MRVKLRLGFRVAPVPPLSDIHRVNDGNIFGFILYDFFLET